MPTQTKKITLDAAALFVGKLVGLLLGIVRLNYIASYLGVANFGILNFATFFCSLFLVLFDLGITQILTRELARDTSKSLWCVGRVIVLKLGIVVATSVLLGAMTLFSRFDHATNWAVLLTTIVFAINGLTFVFLGAFQAHRKMILVSMSTVLNDLLLSVAVVLIIGSYPYVVTVLVLSIAIAVTNLVFLVVVYVRQIGVPQLALDVAFSKILLKESLPLAVSSLGISMYMFIGPTILKYSRGDFESGIYAAGYKIMSILTLVPTAFTQVLYPVFSDFYLNAREKLQKSLLDALRVMQIVSMPLAVGTILLASQLFALVYPPEFASGVVVLQIMIAGITLGYANWILYAFLVAIDRQKLGMVISLCTAIAVIALSLVFIPVYGFMALPFIAVVTEILLFIAEVISLQRIGYRALSVGEFGKPLLSSLVMGTILFLLPEWNILVLVPIGIVSYFCALYLLRGLGEQERELLRGLIARVNPREVVAS